MDTKTVMPYQRSFSSAPILIYILRNRPNHMSPFLFFRFVKCTPLLDTQQGGYIYAIRLNLPMCVELYVKARVKTKRIQNSNLSQ